MIDYQEARRLMLAYLAEIEAGSREIAALRKELTPSEREVLGLGPEDEVFELEIVERETIEEDFGWVFFYRAKAQPGDGDFGGELLGSGPIIVARRDGSLHETGSAEPVEVYIENFKRTGDPQG